MGVTFISGTPPPVGFVQQQERPGRIEYLYLTEPQKIAVEKMNNEIDDLPPLVRLRCQSPQLRTVRGKNVAIFPHMDYDERTPPTEEEAALLCTTSGRMCPLAATCLSMGLALGSDHGVWGGRTLVDGRDYYEHKEETND